ncbi:MAG: hypothetical protein SX243_23725 [Acidobacteriota bacterium]|nr:hypothetical protein [Acidobacteriota bacterium]
MSGSKAPDPEQAEQEITDHQYFQAVEEIFIGLRGAPLLLSPADYRVAAGWHASGIPLDLVREALEEVFERRRERGAKGTVSSLRYCARAVEQAWEDAQELTATAHREAEPESPVGPRLEALAASLLASEEASQGAAAVDLESFSARIRGLEGSSPEVERRLADLDQELLERASDGLSAELREELEGEVESALAKLAGRLPETELERARERLRRQLLRRRLALPVLSLFAPEAEP